MSEQKWQRLIDARKARGLSQEEAAKQCGVSNMTWSRWERLATTPDIEALKKISKGLKVSADYLIENDEYLAFTPEQVDVLSNAADILKSKFN